MANYLYFFFSLLFVNVAYSVEWAPLVRENVQSNFDRIEIVENILFAVDDSQPGYIWFSRDQLSWNKSRIPYHCPVKDIVFGNGQWLVSYWVSDYLETVASNDLFNWRVVVTESQHFRSISFGSGYFWAENQDTHQWFRSKNGINWAPVLLPLTGTFSIVQYEGKTILWNGPTLGYWGDIMFTKNGEDWFVASTDAGGVRDSGSPHYSQLDVYDSLGASRGYIRFNGGYFTFQDKEVGFARQWELFERFNPCDQISGATLLEHEVYQFAFKSSDSIYLATNMGRILFSYDGVHWQFRKESRDFRWTGYSYASRGNDIFFIKNGYLFSLLLGQDQLIRSDLSGYAEHNYMDVIYWKGRFYELGHYALFTSNNAIDWVTAVDTSEMIGVDQQLDISFEGIFETEESLYLFGKQSSGHAVCLVSNNGRDWDIIDQLIDGSSTDNDSISYVVKSANQWLGIIGNYQLVVSEDAINWDKVEGVTGYTPLFYDGSKYLGTHYSNTESKSSFAYSENGRIWTVVEDMVGLTEDSHPNVHSIIKHDGRLYAAGYGKVWDSEQGTAWNELAMPDDLDEFPTTTLVSYESRLYAKHSRKLHVLVHDSWVESFDLPLSIRGVILPEDSEQTLLVVGDGPSLLTQTNFLNKPVVSVRNLVSYSNLMREGQGWTNAFEVRRQGSLDQPLDVDFRVRGSARVGKDYTHNLNPVGGVFRLHFEPDSKSKLIKINPILDEVSEWAQSIDLHMEPSAMFKSTQSRSLFYFYDKLVE